MAVEQPRAITADSDPQTLTNGWRAYGGTSNAKDTQQRYQPIESEENNPNHSNNADQVDFNYHLRSTGTPRTSSEMPVIRSHRTPANRVANGRVNTKRPSSSRRPSSISSPVKADQFAETAFADTVTGKRAFPCPLLIYGCTSNFGSKNEWKRHVYTQHMRLGFWRCDRCSKDNPDRKPNDFNRKDLFIQHVRRMHPSGAQTRAANAKDKSPKIGDLDEQYLQAEASRCYRHLRSPPERSRCLFCEQRFYGHGSWEDRMEHVGRHLERARKESAPIELKDWHIDEDAEQWYIREHVIESHGKRLVLADGRSLLVTPPSTAQEQPPTLPNSRPEGSADRANPEQQQPQQQNHDQHAPPPHPGPIRYSHPPPPGTTPKFPVFSAYELHYPTLAPHPHQQPHPHQHAHHPHPHPHDHHYPPGQGRPELHILPPIHPRQPDPPLAPRETNGHPPGPKLPPKHRQQDDKPQQEEPEDFTEEVSWYFDCSVCGLRGDNIDDGSPSVACERCDVWQHAKCHGVSEEQTEDETFLFFCDECKKRRASHRQPSEEGEMRIDRPRHTESQEDAVMTDKDRSIETRLEKAKIQGSRSPERQEDAIMTDADSGIIADGGRRSSHTASHAASANVQDLLSRVDDLLQHTPPGGHGDPTLLHNVQKLRERVRLLEERLLQPVAEEPTKPKESLKGKSEQRQIKNAENGADVLLSNFASCPSP